MLKLCRHNQRIKQECQPPSGGCVLKHIIVLFSIQVSITQPPSGGCVLKHCLERHNHRSVRQPPSGGCVLKQIRKYERECPTVPAAFRRLCVETIAKMSIKINRLNQPPSGGCVLKPFQTTLVSRYQIQPPSGGCVLKLILSIPLTVRLRQPPSGGCVLKHQCFT